MNAAVAPTPIRWTGEWYDAPYTIMGDQTWSNYTVSVAADGEAVVTYTVHYSW